MSLESRLRMFLESRIKDLGKDIESAKTAGCRDYYEGMRDGFKFILEEFVNEGA